MEQCLLEFDAQIVALEKSQRYATAAYKVYQQWKDEPSNTKRILSAGTYLWHTHLMQDYYKNHPNPPLNIEYIPEETLDTMLMAVTNKGFDILSDDVMFNSYFGYMIKVVPYYFVDYNGDYIGWQQKGISMMEHATMLEPNNSFVKALFFVSNDNPAYESVCKTFWEQITPNQWGDLQVQQYFFYILNGDASYPMAYQEIE